MSEQTPNSSENLSGAEPSMEDILASIRKIISDDEPVAMESPEDSVAAPLETAKTSDPLDSLLEGVDTDEVADEPLSPAEISAPEAESVDLDIDDVLAGLDDDVLAFNASDNSVENETSEAVGFSTSSGVASGIVKGSVNTDDFDSFDVDSLLAKLDPIETDTDVLETDEAVPEVDDDVFALLDDDIPLATETVVPMSSGVDQALASEPSETIATDEDIEMDALLDDILMMPLNGGDVADSNPVLSDSVEEIRSRSRARRRRDGYFGRHSKYDVG